jgi:hypothetical protein
MLYPKNADEFKREFSNEEKCLEYLIKLKYKDGIICSKCKTGNPRKVRMRTYECKKCHHQESVLSGTLFQDTHKPLRLWFWAIWHITKHIFNDKGKKNNGNSARQLQQVLHIKSYKTAWTWMHKLRRIMVHPEKDRLSGDIEIVKFHVKVPKKCGKENDNKIPVAIAMEKFGGIISRVRIGILTDIPQDNLNVFIHESIKEQSNIIIFTDNRNMHRNFEAIGNYRVTFNNQDQYTEEEHINTIIVKLKNWIKVIPPGSTLKHLSYYFDEFTFRYNQRNEYIMGKLFHRLIENAIQMKSITYRNIVDTY